MKIQFYNEDKLNVLHFQHNIYDLGKGYYEVLEREEFCQNLKQYIKRLFELGHSEIIFNILAKVGTCSIEHDNRHIRVKALGIVAYFSTLLNKKRDQDSFQAVVVILTKWLSKEREYHVSYEKIFIQIKAVVTKMFSLRLWGPSQPLVVVSRDIISGNIPTVTSFQRQVSKLHRDIADPQIINSLVMSCLESKESIQPATSSLLKALVPYSSESMIHGLFKCTGREKRLELINMIVAETDGVLPILVEKLKDKQPWYIVRNSMILLGNLEDPDLFSIARPFLSHPDSRVQSETINCIATLGGDNVAERLIASFTIINDAVKGQLINLLVPLHDPTIEIFFTDILEQRIPVPTIVREQLIVAICSNGLFHVSNRSITVLRDMAMTSEYVSVGFDPALDAARKLINKFDDIDNLS